MIAAGRIAAALCAWLPGRKRSGAMPAGDAPAVWGAYAQRVAPWLHAVLDGDDAPARDLRAGVERWADAQAGTGGDGAVLPVRAWFDRRGRVTRVDSGAGGQPALVGRTVGIAPPRGMAQPLVLRVTLTGSR
ncbi:hypothetical protein [Burkholderia arboris]|uniref:hypothetical protein n=1 Tax=Burkholderia arboris TaxID=488730 RepID=UPI0030EFD362